MAEKKEGNSKAAAAAAEKDPQDKSIDWRGHTFKLPPKLPKSLMFRLTEVEEAGNDSRPTLKLLQSLINAADESQYAIIYREIEDAEDEEAVVIEAFELVGKIFELYGTTEGESEASQDS